MTRDHFIDALLTSSCTSTLQLATIIAVYADWNFARIHGCGWGWAGVVWLYSVIFYIPLDILKFIIRFILSGKAWDSLLENKVILLSSPTLEVNCRHPSHLNSCLFSFKMN